MDRRIGTAVGRSCGLDPAIVTAVLADYRGYDTMFETVVVFAAGAYSLRMRSNTLRPSILADSSPLTFSITKTVGFSSRMISK